MGALQGKGHLLWAQGIARGGKLGFRSTGRDAQRAEEGKRLVKCHGKLPGAGMLQGIPQHRASHSILQHPTQSSKCEQLSRATRAKDLSLGSPSPTLPFLLPAAIAS